MRRRLTPGPVEDENVIVVVRIILAKSKINVYTL
jgi:hypothetical protein